MTDKQFSTLWADALESNDRDAYASDWALSSMWEDGKQNVDNKESPLFKRIRGIPL